MLKSFRIEIFSAPLIKCCASKSRVERSYFFFQHFEGVHQSRSNINNEERRELKKVQRCSPRDINTMYL